MYILVAQTVWAKTIPLADDMPDVGLGLEFLYCNPFEVSRTSQRFLRIKQPDLTENKMLKFSF